jgi:biotin carboxyl carrier protein
MADDHVRGPAPGSCAQLPNLETGMSGQILRLEPDPHVAVQRLLPWYLTGRLETAEHDIVETHLARCPECRAELETERQWQLLHPGHGAQVDVEEGWARMRARLSGELPVTAPAPLLAPMPGMIVRVHVQVGDRVQPGQGLVVMEAMKMENELRAQAAATVKAVMAQPGSAVEKGALLIELE